MDKSALSNKHKHKLREHLDIDEELADLPQKEHQNNNSNNNNNSAATFDDINAKQSNKQMTAEKIPHKKSIVKDKYKDSDDEDNNAKCCVSLWSKNKKSKSAAKEKPSKEGKLAHEKVSFWRKFL